MKRINIKLKFLLICFVVVFCFLTSCRTAVRQETQKSETKSESVSEKVISYQDTLIYAPKAETSLKIPISELVFKSNLKGNSKPQFYTQRNGQAKAKITIQHDTITVTASCDSLAIVAKIKKELQREINNQSQADSNIQAKKSGYSLFDVLVSFLTGLVIGAVVVFILKTFKII
jgi:hypothetical protein